MDPENIRELFAQFGPVSVKRMFGGAGIFADEIMIALVHDGVIYLKTDEHSAPAFDREKLEPFTYRRSGKHTSLSYRRMPDRLYDDPDELATWAREAQAAAQRGGGGKKASSGRAGGKRRAQV